MNIQKKYPVVICIFTLLWNLYPGSAQDEITCNQTILGRNVFVFDSGMEMNEIQTLADTIFTRQSTRHSEFNRNRYALLFKPGHYHLDIRVGYYMQIIGLGQSPEDVVITGSVRSNSRHGPTGGHVLTNFWRSVENLTIVPNVDSTNVWGVSQAAPMRRVYVKGNLKLHDNGYASGGFLADSYIEGTVYAGGQQQWCSRNSDWKEWLGGSWNILSIGVPGSPEDNWPEGPYTSLTYTPASREKPYLVFDDGTFQLKVPASRKNSTGPSWLKGSLDEITLNIQDFYIADPGLDNSASINKALKQGKNLLFTPGIYALDQSLEITHPGTVVIGLGMPSLMPISGNIALSAADVDGLIVSGLLFDAGEKESEVLLRMGEPGSNESHADNPSWLFDIFCRVGGPSIGSVNSCVVLNSHDVFVDHIWLWRADHGNGVGWDLNKSAHGMIVNGNDVTIYGLFNEHHQEYQTIWNGNGGRVYLYQSEMPYDPPAVNSWKHQNTGGYASYKVADHVQSHEAWGIGVYCVFYNAPVVVDNAIETPVLLESSMHHKFTFWLNGNENSVIKSIINGKGESVHQSNRKAVLK